jgi:hypothetical protein
LREKVEFYLQQKIIKSFILAEYVYQSLSSELDILFFEITSDFFWVLSVRWKFQYFVCLSTDSLIRTVEMDEKIFGFFVIRRIGGTTPEHCRMIVG